MFHVHRKVSSIGLMGALLLLSTPLSTLAQIKGPIEATVGGDTTIKMEYGNNANAPKADEVVLPKDFKANSDEWLYTQWSWVTWWEANSHLFLQPARPLKPDPDGQTQAQAALLKCLETSSDPKVLAQAVLALGRMQANDASDEIIKLLAHEDSIVRRNSWLALGLIADAPARKAITDVLVQPALTPEDAAAWIVAIGLMEKADPQLLKAMPPIVMQPHILDVDLQGIKAQRNEALIQSRMAMWTLRMHHPQGLETLARRVLDFTTDPILFDQAIQVLAASPDESTLLNMFNVIYHGRPAQWRKFPKAVAFVSCLYPSILESHHELAAMRTSIAVAYDNPAIRSNTRLAHLTGRVLARTYGQVPTAKMQASQPNTPPRLYKFDMWRNHGDDFRLTTPDTVGYALRFGLIPLGKMGDADLKDNEEPADGQLLCDILLGRYTSDAGFRQQDPSRGFAAIALGLYQRRLPADPNSIRNDKLRTMARYIQRLLARTAADGDEPAQLRSACLLAIALGRSATASEDVRQIVTQLASAPDPLVAGYATLALGMLADPMALQLAKQAFEKTSELVDVAQLRDRHATPASLPVTLVQRVIVQGVACIGEPKANVLFYPRLMDNGYTTQQMIRAIKWSGDMQVAQPLMALLENPGKNEQNAALAAWALGELYDKHTVDQLSARLLDQRNITLLPLEKNSYETICPCGKSVVYTTNIQTLPYLQLTNTFLFKEMIRQPRG